MFWRQAACPGAARDEDMHAEPVSAT
jgi:hypothetical protein